MCSGCRKVVEALNVYIPPMLINLHVHARTPAECWFRLPCTKIVFTVNVLEGESLQLILVAGHLCPVCPLRTTYIGLRERVLIHMPSPVSQLVIQHKCISMFAYGYISIYSFCICTISDWHHKPPHIGTHCWLSAPCLYAQGQHRQLV